MRYKYVLLVMAVAAVVALVTLRKPVKQVQASKPAAHGPKTIAAAGRVEPLSEEINISSELNGKLRDVPVEEGSAIRRGQVLAVLMNDDYQARVALADAQVARFTAQQQRVQNGSRSEERREAEAAVLEAKAVLDNSQADVNRYQALFRSGDIPRANLDRIERDVAVAKARHKVARERQQIVEQASRVEDVASADADLAHAKAQLAEAQALLAKTVIRSPLSGTVLRKHLKRGESVSDQPGNPILTIADNSVLRVRVDVDEADVARVAVGQRAYVTAEAHGARRFTGKVVELGQILGRKNVRTDEPTEKVDTKILETLVQLDPGQRLPVGLRVDSYIEVSR